MRKTTFGRLGAAVLALTFAPAASAATLLVNASGELIGATNVDVSGTLYNVSFVDGTCGQVFDGCDDLSDFAFSTSAQAGAAVQALLNQVFIDTGLGNFDSDYTKTLGCETNLYSYCGVWTPFSIGEFSPGDEYSLSAQIGNFNIEINDQQYSDLLTSEAFNTQSYPYYVWARFTPAVPEPSTWAMMLVGFGAIGFSLRRSRQGPQLQLA